MKKNLIFKVLTFLFLCKSVLLNAQIPLLGSSKNPCQVDFKILENQESSRITTSNPPIVKIGYVIPSNRTPQANYKENLQFAVEMAQMWFRDNMEQNGFGPKTFLFETEDDSPRPKIHLVSVPETDSYLWGGDDLTLFYRTQTAAQNAGLSVGSSGEVWILIPETQVQNPDGSFIGGLARGGGGVSGSGNNPGVAQLGSNVIKLFNPQTILDNSNYEGQIIPEWGPYPLVNNISFQWFEEYTFSSVASSYLGALFHEVGHAFGLSHDSRQDSNFFGGLMTNGFRGVRGSFFPTLFPDNYATLENSSSLLLNESHYFNRDKVVNLAPNLSIFTSGTVTPINGLLNIRFMANDTDNVSYALLYRNGNVVDDMTLNQANVDATFKTPFYTDITDTSEVNSYQISVWDKQGNRSMSSSFTLSVPAGYNQAPKPFLKLLYPNAPFSNNTTRFDASYTSDLNNDSFTTEFDVNNDGIFDTSPLSSTIYNYTIPTTGPYMARIRVTDSQGAFAISSPISGNYGKTCGVDAPTISGISKICAGATTKLTSKGCYGTFLWSNGATSSSIDVNPMTSTNYIVSCTYGCASQASQTFMLETVPNSLALSNIASAGVQKAGEAIISMQTIPTASTVTYIAGNSITLLPNFQAQNGSTFSAIIKGCNYPIANADNVTVIVENGSTMINILSNDINPNGTIISDLIQIFSPTIITNPTKGTITVNNDNTISYTPNPNVSGTDSFIYSICNKNNPSFCTTATVSINLQNLIQNANFEAPVNFTTVPWQKGGWKPDQAVFSWLTGQGRNGSNCIKIYSGPATGPVESNDVYIYQTVTLVPNSYYQLKVWIKTENITTNTNPNGIGACLSIIGSAYILSSNLKGTNDWTQISFVFRSGTGVVSIACRLGYTNADSEGTAYFDDLTIEKF